MNHDIERSRVERRQRRIAGGLFVVAAIGFNVFFAILAATFDYPDVLRRPAGDVLTAFAGGGAGLVFTWYGMVAVSILVIVPIVALHGLFVDRIGWSLTVATVFGVLAGLVNALGFLRWAFVVPSLAGVYVDPATSEPTRAAILVTFEAFNAYAGVAIGEHLGYLFFGTWTLLLSVGLLNARLLPAWFGYVGIATAAALLAGLTEPLGVTFASPVVTVGFVGWSLWLIALGLVLIARWDAETAGPRGVESP